MFQGRLAKHGGFLPGPGARKSRSPDSEEWDGSHTGVSQWALLAGDQRSFNAPEPLYEPEEGGWITFMTDIEFLHNTTMGTE